MEINLSRDAKTALHKMVHQSNVEPKDIADMLGDSHKTVLNYGNPNMEHLPSLKKVEAIIKFTRNPALIKVWAHKLGFMLVPAAGVEENDRDACVVESLLGVNSTTGQINQNVLCALEDGHVTPAELNQAMEVIESLKVNIHQLETALKNEAAKYLSAYRNEKA